MKIIYNELIYQRNIADTWY